MPTPQKCAPNCCTGSIVSFKYGCIKKESRNLLSFLFLGIALYAEVCYIYTIQIHSIWEERKMEKRIPKREELDQRYCWAIEDVFASDEA